MMTSKERKLTYRPKSRRALEQGSEFRRLSDHRSKFGTKVVMPDALSTSHGPSRSEQIQKTHARMLHKTKPRLTPFVTLVEQKD